MTMQPDAKPHRFGYHSHGRRWTRERVIAALKRFYQVRGVAPTSSEEWNDLTANTGVPLLKRPYPSFASVLGVFPSFREAWAELGVDVGRYEMAWSEAEDWYLREGAGIISRIELAADLQRTADAVHRRMYDLGLHSYRQWGWTLNRLERVSQFHRHVFERYMDWGDLPYFRGSKCLYVDPADLVVVAELDLEHLPQELEEAMRYSLRRRLVQVLAGQDWRRTSIYQPHRTVAHRYAKGRKRGSPQKPTPRPSGIEKGDYVRVAVNVPSRPQLIDRIGLVHFVYWASARSGNSIRTSSIGDWMARVEFKSQHNRSKGPRVRYSVPLAYLQQVPEPEKAGNRKVRCPCGWVFVLAPHEPTPENCSFCSRELKEARGA